MLGSVDAGELAGGDGREVVTRRRRHELSACHPTERKRSHVGLAGSYRRRGQAVSSRMRSWNACCSGVGGGAVWSFISTIMSPVTLILPAMNAWVTAV